MDLTGNFWMLVLWTAAMLSFGYGWGWSGCLASTGKSKGLDLAAASATPPVAVALPPELVLPIFPGKRFAYLGRVMLCVGYSCPPSYRLPEGVQRMESMGLAMLPFPCMTAEYVDNDGRVHGHLFLQATWPVIRSELAEEAAVQFVPSNGA